MPQQNEHPILYEILKQNVVSVCADIVNLDGGDDRAHMLLELAERSGMVFSQDQKTLAGFPVIAPKSYPPLSTEQSSSSGMRVKAPRRAAKVGEGGKTK